MSELDISISALSRLRDEFQQDFTEYSDFYYAIIKGSAVQNGGVAFPQPNGEHRSFEDYLKDHIANGKPWNNSVGWKHPRYFFFGDHVVPAATRFSARCRVANVIIREGLQAVRQKPGDRDLAGGLLPEHWHLLGESLVEHEWMFWMRHLGDALNDPLLSFRREEFSVVSEIFGPTVFVASFDGSINLQCCSISRDSAPVAILPEWQYALDCVRDGSLEEVEVFDRPIFYSSAVMAEHLIQLAGGRRLTASDSAASKGVENPTVRQIVADEPYEWARQIELVRATNQVLAEGTLDKGVVSRACSKGHVLTNGKTGRAARVSASSFLAWVTRKFHIGKDEQNQIRNAIIGEIRERNP